MGESIKSTCHFILIVAVVAAVVGWSSRSPDVVAWSLRIGCPIVGLLALAIALWLDLRRDLTPDYLSKRIKRFFSRDGLCFSVAAVADDGVCYMAIAFQNQQDQPSTCRIGVRPVEGMNGRPRIVPITLDIECGPAAYGVARVPLPLAKRYQGKRRLFEVGASVRYPCGKGHRLRFREGTGISKNAEFRDVSGTMLGLTLGLVWHFFGLIYHLSRLARSRVKVALPTGVAEQPQDHTLPEVKTLWQFWDAPLSSDD